MNFKHFVESCRTEDLHQNLFESRCPNKYNKGTCLHVIAFYQRLSFYQYLEEVFTPQYVLTQFCENLSEYDRKVPFQISCKHEDTKLLHYVYRQLKLLNQEKEFIQKLEKLLRHADYFNNTVFIDLVCFEKIDILKEIYFIGKNWPSLLRDRDFTKRCQKDQSIEKIMMGCGEINGNKKCFMPVHHQTQCQSCAVANLLTKMRELCSAN